MKLIKTAIFIVLLIITYFSLRVSSDVTLPTNDKVGHFLAYTVLSYTILLICDTNKRKWIGIIFSICYGFLMEFLQGFVPGRDPSILDMIANSFGALIGLVIPFKLIIKEKIKLIESKIFNQNNI